MFQLEVRNFRNGIENSNAIDHFFLGYAMRNNAAQQFKGKSADYERNYAKWMKIKIHNG